MERQANRDASPTRKHTAAVLRWLPSLCQLAIQLPRVPTRHRLGFLTRQTAFPLAFCGFFLPSLVSWPRPRVWRAVFAAPHPPGLSGRLAPAGAQGRRPPDNEGPWFVSKRAACGRERGFGILSER
jgi:hypothetical protein